MVSAIDPTTATVIMIFARCMLQYLFEASGYRTLMYWNTANDKVNQIERLWQVNPKMKKKKKKKKKKKTSYKIRPFYSVVPEHVWFPADIGINGIDQTKGHQQEIDNSKSSLNTVCR